MHSRLTFVASGQVFYHYVQQGIAFFFSFDFQLAILGLSGYLNVLFQKTVTFLAGQNLHFSRKVWRKNPCTHCSKLSVS